MNIEEVGYVVVEGKAAKVMLRDRSSATHIADLDVLNAANDCDARASALRALVATAQRIREVLL